MNVLIINGGMPKGGRTEQITRYIAYTYEFDYIDINSSGLPIMTGDPTQFQMQQVVAFKDKVREADGVILISPEYYAGMTGALKNALDFLTSDQLAHKPVALLATAGGGKGGINCLNNMRTVMRSFYANIIPKQLVLDPHCFTDDGGLWDEPKRMVSDMVMELRMYVEIASQLKLNQH